MAVYLLAIAAAALFGLGSVIQQRVAFEAPPGMNLRPSLLWWLLRQPAWLAGVGTAVVGNGFSAAALGMGSVALVQPLLVSRLVFALPLAAVWAKQRLTGRDWLGMLATAGGLAAFLIVGRPSDNADVEVADLRWAYVAGAVAVLTGTLVWLARRWRPALEAPVLGSGAGMLFGLQSGLMHAAVSRFDAGGVLSVALSWTPYAVAGAAIAGTLLAQSAYEMAPLQSSYPALAAVEPLAGIGVSIGVLGGSLATGAGPMTGTVAALAVMTCGIWLLATSPLVTSREDEMTARAYEEAVWRAEDELVEALDRLESDLRRQGRRRPARLDDRLRADQQRIEQDLAAYLELLDAPPAAFPAGSGDHAAALEQWHQDRLACRQSLERRARAAASLIDDPAAGPD